MMRVDRPGRDCTQLPGMGNEVSYPPSSYGAEGCLKDERRLKQAKMDLRGARSRQENELVQSGPEAVQAAACRYSSKGTGSPHLDRGSRGRVGAAPTTISIPS